MKVSTIKNLLISLFKDNKRLRVILLEKFSFLFPDKLYLSMLFKLLVGYNIDWNNPKSFNEKLNWLKLYHRKQLYTSLVDKAQVKDYVSKIIGEQYVIKTLGIWDSTSNIEWKSLPEQFVLKTTNGGGGGGVIICKSKHDLNKEKIEAMLNQALKQNIYRGLREWPYKNVIPRILAEEYLEDSQYHELPDYKFFCFDGEVKALFVATERFSGDVKFDFFDSDFNHLDIVQKHPMSQNVIKKPACFEEMKQIASNLSKGIPHVRIDLYEVNGRVYFGEMTFYHHGGMVPFHPSNWDYIFGSWLRLPNKFDNGK